MEKYNKYEFGWFEIYNRPGGPFSILKFYTKVIVNSYEI